MHPRTEELLYVLLWSAEKLMRPTYWSLTEGFDEWAWRNRLTRRLAELEREKLIERHPDPALERVVRLTDLGRLRALGGRDPLEEWARPWDGTWRIVLFDLPTARTDLRQQLLRTLRRNHFGYLQNSVWITPSPTSVIRAQIGTAPVEADAFLIIEGRPAAGESDEEMVRSGWNFDAINRRYDAYLRFTEETVPTAGAARIAWARRENRLWKDALRDDPLLPAVLLPKKYRGPKAVEARRKIFAKLAGNPAA